MNVWTLKILCVKCAMEDRPSHACQEMHIQLQHGTPTQILLNILRLQPEVFFLYTSLTSLLLIFLSLFLGIALGYVDPLVITVRKTYLS